MQNTFPHKSMNKNIYLVAIISFCLLSVQRVTAQTDSCITSLKNANSRFENNDYDNVIKLLLWSTSNCNLNKNDKIQAYKLLALSYLRIDNLEEADRSARAIIKINPNYSPDKFKDDPKFSELFEKFKTEPTLIAGIEGGFNFTTIKVVKTFSIVHNDDDPDLGSYSGKTGFQLGAHAEYRTYKNLWTQLGFQFRSEGYKHELNNVEGTSIFYSEKLSYFDFPVSVKYYFLTNKIQPYIQSGASATFLSGAISTTSRADEKDLADRTSLRNTFSIGYMATIGVSYRIKSLRIFSEARLMNFSKLVNKEGTRFSDQLNSYKYYYIDDDFQMNHFEINLGIAYELKYRNRR